MTAVTELLRCRGDEEHRLSLSIRRCSTLPVLGHGSPNSPTAEEDNRTARLAIRAILCNPAITAPIPGLISVQQVDNVALAVAERRELDRNERAALERAMDHAWANLPPGYQWLRNREFV